MTETLEAMEYRVGALWRRANLFCLPLFLGGALLMADTYLWTTPVPGLSFALILGGLLIGAVPMIRYQRAKTAYDRAKKRAQLSELARFLEVGE